MGVEGFNVGEGLGEVKRFSVAVNGCRGLYRVSGVVQFFRGFKRLSMVAYSFRGFSGFKSFSAVVGVSSR